MSKHNNENILAALRLKYISGEFRDGTVEIQGASFRCDREFIVPDTINQEYQDAEIEWYERGDRRVQTLFDIYGQEVKIWKNVADSRGMVNSNYGWCIYSAERGHQYAAAYDALRKNQFSRQAVMYYTVPEMHEIAGKDHTCTYAVQYFLNFEQDTFSRGYLDAHVFMRSNDAVFGFNNDYAWQRHVLGKLASDLNCLQGDIYWNVGSMHVYQRHYDKLMANQLELEI